VADDSATIVATEVQGIEDALDVLLTAAKASEDEIYERDRHKPDRFKSWSIGDIHRHWDATPPTQRKVEDLIANPVGQACRLGIVILGKRLHEIGGLSAMSAACDNVAERHSSRWWGFRMSVMDARWDGIGRTGDSAGWCS
jgi:hypothetical protein